MICLKEKRILKAILIFFGLLLFATFFFINSMTPSYQGTKDLSILDKEVVVHYDTYGIPHIYADSKLDAMRALGWVQAQDRLWQMELLRRVAAGRLSEIFGEVTVDTDKFFFPWVLVNTMSKVFLSLIFRPICFFKPRLT